MDLCRLCGLEKTAEESLFDISDETVQETFRKCSVYIEKNKLLPQNICTDCFEIVDNFSKFLDNVAQVQERLSQNLHDQLDTAPLYCKIKSEDEIEENGDSITKRPKKGSTVRKKRPASFKVNDFAHLLFGPL